MSQQVWHNSVKLHSHQTPDQPRSFPTKFYGLVGYDRVKNYPLWLKSVSIPDQHPLYPRCIPDAPTLKSRSSRPTPVLPTDQSPPCMTNPRPIPDATTLTTLNIGPIPDLIFTPGLKWIIQASYVSSVPEMRTWPILLIKSDLKCTIYISILIMNSIMHLFYFGIHFIGHRVEVISGFCVGFPIEVFVWYFEINISTTYKRLQHNSGHSVIYDYCNLLLNIL